MDCSTLWSGTGRKIYYPRYEVSCVLLLLLHLNSQRTLPASLQFGSLITFASLILTTNKKSFQSLLLIMLYTVCVYRSYHCSHFLPVPPLCLCCLLAFDVIIDCSLFFQVFIDRPVISLLLLPFCYYSYVALKTHRLKRLVAQPLINLLF